MSRSGTLVYTERGLSQDAGDALRGDIVRGLVELITNADDAYMRGNLHGGIKVLVEHLDDAELSARITVSDQATGMNAEEMVAKLTRLGARASEFEDGAQVRGLHGRGARDLGAFGVVDFESVKADKYSKLTIRGTEWNLVAEDVPVTDEILERLSLEAGQSGTTVRVHVRKPLSVEPDTADRLAVHAELRHILSEREVTLSETGMRVVPTRPLIYESPEVVGELVDTEVEIPGSGGATAHFKVWELKEPATGPVGTETHHGILIRGTRATYDNTLFDLAGRPGAGYLQGEFTCDLIEQMVRDYDDREERNEAQSEDNPIRILTRSRDGLIGRHPLTRKIKTLFSTVLLPVIQDLEVRHTGERKPSEEVRRRLQRAGRELARLLADDLAEIDEEVDGGWGEETAAVKLIPSRTTLRPHEKKTLTIHTRPQLLPDDWDGDIAVVADEKLIEIVGTLDPLTAHDDDPNLLVSRVRLIAKDSEGEGRVTVRAATEAANCEVIVDATAPPPPDAPGTLEFSHESYSLRKDRKRSVELQAPLDFLAGIEAEATVIYRGDLGIDLLTSACRLRLDENLGWYRGRVSLIGVEVGSAGEVMATLNAHEAVAGFKVVEPSDPQGLDLEIAWEDRKQGPWRGALTQEPAGLKLVIFGRHPAIEDLLGDWDEESEKYANDDSEEVALVLAEIIASEMAHHLLERDFARPGRDFDAPGYAAKYRRSLDRYLRVAQGLLAPAGE